MMDFDNFSGIEVKEIKDKIEDVSGLMDIKDKIDALGCGMKVTLKRMEYKARPELDYNFLHCEGRSFGGTWFDFCIRRLDDPSMIYVAYVDWIDMKTNERKRVQRAFSLDMVLRMKCFSGFEPFEMVFKQTVDELFRYRWEGYKDMYSFFE
ncbi:MAG: hypothetical protein IIT63_14090 [Prevotella sp.]|nr:hypothetical protein [Prevotella sp.]